MQFTKEVCKSFSKNAYDSFILGGETGEWTVKTAKEFGVDAGTIRLALEERKKSKKKPRFAGKVVAALRNEFGGHEVINGKR